MILRKSFYIRWSAGRSPRVHEVNPGRDPSIAPTVVDPLEEEQSAKREEVKPSVPPPFPQALQKKKNSVNQTEILEVLR